MADNQHYEEPIQYIEYDPSVEFGVMQSELEEVKDENTSLRGQVNDLTVRLEAVEKTVGQMLARENRSRRYLGARPTAVTVPKILPINVDRAKAEFSEPRIYDVPYWYHDDKDDERARSISVNYSKVMDDVRLKGFGCSNEAIKKLVKTVFSICIDKRYAWQYSYSEDAKVYLSCPFVEDLVTIVFVCVGGTLIDGFPIADDADLVECVRTCVNGALRDKIQAARIKKAKEDAAELAEVQKQAQYKSKRRYIDVGAHEIVDAEASTPGPSTKRSKKEKRRKNKENKAPASYPSSSESD